LDILRTISPSWPSAGRPSGVTGWAAQLPCVRKRRPADRYPAHRLTRPVGDGEQVRADAAEFRDPPDGSDVVHDGPPVLVVGAAMAHNLLRDAATLTDTFYAKARTATVRRDLVAVPARIARRGPRTRAARPVRPVPPGAPARHWR
jgi:hypothetical protein